MDRNFLETYLEFGFIKLLSILPDFGVSESYGNRSMVLLNATYLPGKREQTATGGATFEDKTNINAFAVVCVPRLTRLGLCSGPVDVN